MKNRKFKVQVTIVTNTISQNFSTSFTTAVLGTYTLKCHKATKIKLPCCTFI